MSDKRFVARSLEEIARYLEISEKNRFKSLAYLKAARKIEDLNTDVVTFVESGEIERTPGIGKAIGPIIIELVKTGQSRYLEDLRKQYPAGIFDLMEVEGLGLRKLGMLYEKLAIGTLEELESACRTGRLTALRGFGKKTEEKILQSIEQLRTRETRYLLPTVLEIAESLVSRLRAIEGVEAAEISGSLRRRLEIASEIDIAFSAKDSANVFETLLTIEFLDGGEIVDPGTMRGRVRNDVPVILHRSRPNEFASTLLFSTGSAEFVAGLIRRGSERGLQVTARGIKKGAQTLRTSGEAEIFRNLELPLIVPELRETTDWLDRSEGLDRLVHVGALRGTFHAHTTYSDGRSTLYEMLDAARDRGFDYVGISDHSKTASYARGLTEDRVEEQHREIENLRPAFPELTIFKGTEADILQDGAIDYGPDTLRHFDFVIASVHSRFKTPVDEMTARIVRALENPFVTFLGHLTGRLLLSRPGYEIHYDQVFEAAARNGVIIEINGNPHRLELDWRLMQRALAAGVLFSIHPDAHSVESLGNVLSGSWAARKGGVREEQVFNTLPAEQIAAHFAHRKARAEARFPAGRAISQPV